ncbi:MAG: hypothetical protein Q2306_01705 [Phytoplasma sp.]|uniref:hypothetical protein n=1 Tax=Phytoplasma sp. TaxID=2155 RepID=UPI002B40AF03|nr:hypothetical protein [Phytoplasma sp.]WRH06603.1 MAG: hypothetical protein Q2306_01705 [Phytoplasma sp.]
MLNEIITIPEQYDPFQEELGGKAEEDATILVDKLLIVLKQKHSKLYDKDQIAQRYRGHLISQDANIKDLKNSIKQKDIELDKLKSISTVTEKTISQQNAFLRAKDIIIRKHDATIKEKDATIEKKDKTIKEKQTELDELKIILDNILKQKNADIKTLENNQKKIINEKENLKQTIKETSSKIKNINMEDIYINFFAYIKDFFIKILNIIIFIIQYIIDLFINFFVWIRNINLTKML